MAPSFEVEILDSLEAQDLEQALALMDAVYPGKFDRRIWDWKYAFHYLGAARVAVARAGGRIVGLQPSIRHEAWWSGSSALAYQLCDVLTHPDHRRQGIFTALVEAFARRADQETACCVFTFPNRLSYPGFARAGSWEHPFSLPLLVRLAASAGGRRRGLTGDVAVARPVERFDAGVDELGAALPRRFAAGTLRDHRYLNWRYLDHPRRPYVRLAVRDGSRWRAAGVGRVVRWLGVKAGAIVDLLGDPDALVPLVIGLEEALIRQGARVLGTLMLPGREEAEILRRLGYQRLPSWVARKEFYFVVRAREPLPASLRRPDGWWLTWGNIDIV